MKKESGILKTITNLVHCKQYKIIEIIQFERNWASDGLDPKRRLTHNFFRGSVCRVSSHNILMGFHHLRPSHSLSYSLSCNTFHHHYHHHNLNHQHDHHLHHQHLKQKYLVLRYSLLKCVCVSRKICGKLGNFVGILGKLRQIRKVSAKLGIFCTIRKVH